MPDPRNDIFGDQAGHAAGNHPFVRSFLLLVLVLPLLLIPSTGDGTADEPPRTLQLNYQEFSLNDAVAHGGRPVIFLVSPDQTVIRRAGEVVTIDYHNREVIREETERSVLVRYPLVSPELARNNDADLADAIMTRLGSYRIMRTQGSQRMHGLNAVEYQIWFGLGLTAARTAAPMNYAYFGQSFAERRVRCLASDKVAHYAALASMAESRRDLVRANPLLLQMDLVNLIRPLDGLPLRLEEQDGTILRFLAVQALR